MAHHRKYYAEDLKCHYCHNHQPNFQVFHLKYGGFATEAELESRSTLVPFCDGLKLSQFSGIEKICKRFRGVRKVTSKTNMPTVYIIIRSFKISHNARVHVPEAATGGVL